MSIMLKIERMMAIYRTILQLIIRIRFLAAHRRCCLWGLFWFPIHKRESSLGRWCGGLFRRTRLTGWWRRGRLSIFCIIIHHFFVRIAVVVHRSCCLCRVAVVSIFRLRLDARLQGHVCLERILVVRFPPGGCRRLSLAGPRCRGFSAPSFGIGGLWFRRRRRLCGLLFLLGHGKRTRRQDFLLLTNLDLLLVEQVSKLLQKRSLILVFGSQQLFQLVFELLDCGL